MSPRPRSADMVSLLGIRPPSYATLCDIDNGYYVSGDGGAAQNLNLIRLPRNRDKPRQCT